MTEKAIIDLSVISLEMETLKSEVFKSPVIAYSPLPDCEIEVGWSVSVIYSFVALSTHNSNFLVDF